MRTAATLFDAAIGAELPIVAEASDDVAVLLVEGAVVSPFELRRDWGASVLVVVDDARLAERLRRAGYKTSAPPGPLPESPRDR